MNELFSNKNNEIHKQVYNLEDGQIELYNGFFTPTVADRLFNTIVEESQWQQDKIKLYGKEHLVPRLTALYGDGDKTYTYSNIKMSPSHWTESLLLIRQKLQEYTSLVFTNVLLNYYRTGQDSMGWHRDNEPELGENPVIASVSFGETRPFHLRHKFKDQPKVIIPLHHGSLLLMKGTTQHFWEHQVPKTAKPIKPRLNLTFRIIR